MSTVKSIFVLIGFHTGLIISLGFNQTPEPTACVLLILQQDVVGLTLAFQDLSRVDLCFGIHNGNAQLVDCLDSDREALIDFKEGLKDPENRLSSWRGNNCCQGEGISCDNKTRDVIAIDLHNPFPSSDPNYSRYALGGKISPSLIKLNYLRHLDLSLNGFSGIPIPEFFQSLEKLQYLNLADAGFGGKIPPNLGNISALQYFNASNNCLTVDNLEWMTSLTSLKYLALNGVDLSSSGSEWVGALNRLSHLTELHLQFCDLIDSNSFLNFVNHLL
ncbi:hypothetical protein GH714_040488 [Hevea brasiliensis]|uniref:Leucine-rich repeat-containing N-terminal plant-type domain-containing protein n=1 Tax=Hevea brasiliensis TaxID=3981 RepID=A0A6A6LA67_HEVBR|nr:hypothetical protein GH714_040488 [Hevea brasiliensis]